ncbi:MAG: MCE family protein [Thermoleophilaceae bacterium]|nr:MCE family protein [Thermoleophilaceae bacterium]
MPKQAPSLGRVLMMVVFALSCVGILLYLWLVFGGASPLRAKGYQLNVDFPEATTLAQEADVRISGVTVGKVKKKELVRVDGRTKPLTRVRIEIARRYAPIPRDTRAILRQKTLLGETYVELTPGHRASGELPDGGTLAQGNVAQTVELDEIFRTFDPETRQAFRTWLQQQGTALRGRGQSLNDALGNLTPFAENTDKVLRVLDAQSAETSRLIRNTGVVFRSLAERDGQLRDLITSSNRVFAQTAARDRQLADAFRAFPRFLDESRATVTRVSRFAEDTNPLITDLRPAARQLSPTLVALDGLAPDLRGLFENLGPLQEAGRRGLPALSRFLDDTTPLLGQVDPWLRNVNPILRWIGLYRREIAAFFANDSAATQAVASRPGATAPRHYLRVMNPVNPEVLAAYPNRIRSNRSNPYVAPGGYEDLAKGGLKVFDPSLCTSNPVPTLTRDTSRLSPDTAAMYQQRTFDLIEQFIYGTKTPDQVAAPPCRAQAPLGSAIGQSGRYPHLTQDPAR